MEISKELQRSLALSSFIITLDRMGLTYHTRDILRSDIIKELNEAR